MYIIRIAGTATGEPHWAVGQFIKSYDPEYHLPNGQYDGGILDATSDSSAAMQFSNLGTLHKFVYQSVPCTCHGLRPDGEPNRPLTAFNLQILQVPEVKVD
jgi:hypothetical protein